MTEENILITANNITCPYCGHEDRDSWEYDLDNGDTEEIDCKNCGKLIFVLCNVHTSTTYTTRLKHR